MSTDSSVKTLLSDQDFLEQLRAQMLRFAVLQLTDQHLAEDAVQEALIGALKNADSFAGKAALKTWVFAILKNKIIDILRKRQRLVNESSLQNPDNENDDLSLLFDQQGHWQTDESPADWGNPHESLHDSQFWKVFEACLDNLPAQQALVFMMREFIELDSDEICASADVTTSNLNVMLYRARLRLRECLENRWFNGD